MFKKNQFLSKTQTEDGRRKLQGRVTRAARENPADE